MRQLIVAVALLGVCTSPLFAQWPRYRVPAVPRTAAGAPDLNAAAPRTPDGKPDLSGIWENFRKPGEAPVRSVNAQFFDDRPPSLINEFRDIGESVKGGLPLQPWAAALKQQRMTEHSKDNPDASCLPMGYMQSHTHSQPRRLVQLPNLIVILYEANAGTRQIFLDARPAPPADAQPWWWGYSRGRWDGDTLIVESTNFRDGGWLDVNGAPLTSEGKIVERFRRPNLGTLEIDVTIDDPKAYTKPWTVRVNQRLLPDADLIEFVCLENNQFNSATGSRLPR